MNDVPYVAQSSAEIFSMENVDKAVANIDAIDKTSMEWDLLLYTYFMYDSIDVKKDFLQSITGATRASLQTALKYLQEKNFITDNTDVTLLTHTKVALGRYLNEHKEYNSVRYLLNIAYAFCKSDNRRAINYLHKALYIQKALKNNDNCTLDITTQLGLCYTFYDTAQSKHFLEKALKLSATLGNVNKPFLYCSLGLVNSCLGNFQTSFDQFTEVITMQESSDFERMMANNMLSFMCVDIEKNDEALDHAREAYNLASNAHDESFVFILSALANVFCACNKTAAAEIYIPVALEACDTFPGGSSCRGLACVLHKSASLEYKKGNYERALTAIRRSIEISEAIFLDRKNIYMADSFVVLSKIALALKNYDDAADAIAKAFKIYEQLQVASHPYFVEALLVQGKIADAKGNDGQACFKQALAIAQEWQLKGRIAAIEELIKK